MEDYFINKHEKNLKIGDFGISFLRKGNGPTVQIPFSGMAFYQPNEVQKDFYFVVNQEDDCERTRTIWGSSEFSNPTFLYGLNGGGYEWRTQKQRFLELSFHISSDWTTFTLYKDETGTKGADAFREFGSLFCYAVLNYHACVLHGVVMEYNGMGILVTAPSGTGKTTHTRMWRDRERALILNGDRCLCRKIDGKWYAYGMPWSGSSGEYINRRVPITAIVCLKQARENDVWQMNPFEGTIAVMQRIFAPIWQCEMQNKAFDIAEELAAAIPVFELACRPDFEAVDVLKGAIEKLERAKL